MAATEAAAQLQLQRASGSTKLATTYLLPTRATTGQHYLKPASHTRQVGADTLVACYWLLNTSISSDVVHFKVHNKFVAGMPCHGSHMTASRAVLLYFEVSQCRYLHTCIKAWKVLEVKPHTLHVAPCM